MSDLINRADLIKAINDRSTHLLNEWDTMGVLMVIDEQPTIEERKKGKWIDKYKDGCLICSLCGNPAEINCISGEFMETNYCSECGADMRGEANERTEVCNLQE